MLVLYILAFLPLPLKFEIFPIQMSRRSQIPQLTSQVLPGPSITHESVPPRQRQLVRSKRHSVGPVSCSQMEGRRRRNYSALSAVAKSAPGPLRRRSGVEYGVLRHAPLPPHTHVSSGS